MHKVLIVPGLSGCEDGSFCAKLSAGSRFRSKSKLFSHSIETANIHDGALVLEYALKLAKQIDHLRQTSETGMEIVAHSFGCVLTCMALQRCDLQSMGVKLLFIDPSFDAPTISKHMGVKFRPSRLDISVEYRVDKIPLSEIIDFKFYVFTKCGLPIFLKYYNRAFFKAEQLVVYDGGDHCFSKLENFSRIENDLASDIFNSTSPDQSFSKKSSRIEPCQLVDPKPIALGIAFEKH